MQTIYSPSTYVKLNVKINGSQGLEWFFMVSYCYASDDYLAVTVSCRKLFKPNLNSM